MTSLTAPPLTPAQTETFIRRALIVTDQTILNNAAAGTTAPAFTLRAVLGKLATEAGAGQTAVQMYRQWWDVFNPSPGLTNRSDTPHCSDRSGKLNGFDYSCRAAEGAQAAANSAVTIDSYFPIGLINRFDLAPTDGANCGEYRIAFAKSGAISTDRSLVIFEAVLANPNPTLGIEGCLPVQTFWADLVNDNVASSRAIKLRNFYFNGLSGFGPIVSINNYGKTGGEGQIRVNIFRQFNWNLREFKLQNLPSCTVAPCELAFVPVTDKVNPAPILFGPVTGPQASLIQEFQNEFISQVPSLAVNDINRFTFSMPDRYNTGQSDSQVDRYGVTPAAPAAFLSAITAAIPVGTGLTAQDILARATTQSCAGCHNMSNNAPIGQGLVWPAANNFVHIGDVAAQEPDGQFRFPLSPALTSTFLPHRLNVMRDFLATFTPSLSVSVGTPKVLLERGTPSTVHVTTSRHRVGPVTVALVSPPAGLTSNTLTLPEGVNEGDLNLSVPLGQAPGALGSVTIRASGGALIADAPLAVVVRGNAGGRDTSFGAAGSFDLANLNEGRFLEMESNGDLLVGGVNTSFATAFAAVRADGGLDPSYGTAGVAAPSLGYPLREAGAWGMDASGSGALVFLVHEELETRTGDVWLGALDPSGVFPASFSHTAAPKKGRRIELSQGGQQACGVTFAANEYAVATRDLALNSLRLTFVQLGGEIDGRPGNPSTVLSGLPITYCGAPTYVDQDVVVPYSLGNGLGLASASRPRVERGIGTVRGRAARDSQKRVTVSTSFDRAGVRVASFLRLLQDGTLDPVSDIPAQGFVGEARSAFPYDDGRVLVAGYATVGSVRKAALARFKADGQLDLAFGSGGVALVAESITANTEAIEVAVQPEGEIVVLVSRTGGSPFLVRLWR